MRFLGPAVVLLALLGAHAWLLQARRALSEEQRRVLEAEASLTRDSSEAAAAAAERQRVDRLLSSLEEKTSRSFGIGPLREAFIAAESGLSLDRLSLEFRPDERLPVGLAGSRVQASLRGDYTAIARYLRRVESLGLPAAAENLTFRGDGEDVSLSIRWSARWPLDAETAAAAPPVPAAEELAALERWLQRAPVEPSARNPFLPSPAASAESESATVPPPPARTADSTEPAPEGTEHEDAVPDLAGFVLARPELERDVGRRVLAALRHEGIVRLFQVGDNVGDYVVESIDARESVTLRTGDGRRLRLTLE